MGRLLITLIGGINYGYKGYNRLLNMVGSDHLLLLIVVSFDGVCAVRGADMAEIVFNFLA